MWLVMTAVWCAQMTAGYSKVRCNSNVSFYMCILRCLRHNCTHSNDTQIQQTLIHCAHVQAQIQSCKHVLLFVLPVTVLLPWLFAGVQQSQLETVIPRQEPGYVMLLSGRHKTHVSSPPLRTLSFTLTHLCSSNLHTQSCTCICTCRCGCTCAVSFFEMSCGGSCSAVILLPNNGRIAIYVCRWLSCCGETRQRAQQRCSCLAIGTQSQRRIMTRSVSTRAMCPQSQTSSSLREFTYMYCRFEMINVLELVLPRCCFSLRDYLKDVSKQVNCYC